MHDAVMAALPQADAIILCAAVADYRVENIANSKIKREKTENPIIQLTPNPDIARAVGQAKRPDQVSVGFALETDNENTNAQGKLERKNLNFIVMNSLRDKNAGFQVDTNKVTIFTDNGDVIEGECKSKRAVAHDIVDILQTYLSTK
jgi:phosphopantothenoylcysteine decarboxylase/phosphopantothenate--cysteine ligase